MDWYLSVLKKYAVFEGRARRKEYWMYALFQFVIAVVLGVISFAAKIPWLYLIYILATLLPSLGVTVRRLHDTDRSGWWILFGLIPIAGPITLLVFYCLDGTPAPNRFGLPPKSAPAVV